MTAVDLTAADWQRAFDAMTKGPVLGTSVQDARIHDAIVPVLPPAPPPVVSSITIALTTDKAGVIVTAAPTGTAFVHFAELPSITGTAVEYPDRAFPLAEPFKPRPEYPVVDAIAFNASKTPIGQWAGRIQTVPAVKPPPPPPPSGAMKVGVDSGGWWLTNDAAWTAGKCKLMRGQNMPTERLSANEKAGYTMVDLIGHNPATTVNAEQLANEAIARAKAHPNIVATEILNEPQNPYLSGSESQASIEAYAKLVNHIAGAFVLAYAGAKMPALLWSCDGGYAGVPSWGAKVWPLLDPNAKRYGFPTCHPYGGTGERAKSAQGGRKRVEEAHALTGLPVWVTEIGWPTAVGQPNTGDSLQWSEAEQAANIESFLKWAPPFCAAVIVFQWHDYSPNNWYGILRNDGSRKPSYDVMQRMA